MRCKPEVERLSDALLGYSARMTETPDEDRVDARADLLPEERAAGGSEDAQAQAEAILAESDERTDAPAATRRESTQTPDDPIPQEDLEGRA